MLACQDTKLKYHMRFTMNPVLTLETTAYTLEQLISLPEAQIALAGRSNVGKSSLINALAGRKKLAKVSSTPGKTRRRFAGSMAWGLKI